MVISVEIIFTICLEPGGKEERGTRDWKTRNPALQIEGKMLVTAYGCIEAPLPTLVNAL